MVISSPPVTRATASRLALVMDEPGSRSHFMWPEGACGGMACTSTATRRPSFSRAVTPTYLPFRSASVAAFAVDTPTSGARWSCRSLPSRDLTAMTLPSTAVMVPRMRCGACAAAPAATAARTSAQAIRFTAPSGVDLPAHFAALVGGGMHVDVEVARLPGLHLRCRQLAALGHAVGIAVLGERHDDRAVLALGALVDVRHRALHVLGRDTALHRAVFGEAQAAAARALGIYGRHFLGARELDAHRAAARHPGRHGVLVGGAGAESEHGECSDDGFKQVCHGRSSSKRLNTGAARIFQPCRRSPPRPRFRACGF